MICGFFKMNRNASVNSVLLRGYGLTLSYPF